VYAPHSGVKSAVLLPLDAVPAKIKKCGNHLDGEVLLSLLVDTNGTARDIMFQSPSGSDVDRFAIAIANVDRFKPGTLDGKPVVVAESLRLYIESCVVTSKDAAGKITNRRVIKNIPHQRLEKPRNPPQEAVLAPIEVPESEIVRTVMRPDYFGATRSSPVLIYSVDAPYTPTTKGATITGVCKLSLVVDANGLPQNVRVIKPLDPGLDQTALIAVNSYRFFPAIEDEEPVPAAIVISVNFAPPDME
jgi:TonB family protein